MALRFLAVFADFLNAATVGAPALPTLRIRSDVLPAAFCAFMRAHFYAMLRYNPGLLMATLFLSYGHPWDYLAFDSNPHLRLTNCYSLVIL